MQCAGAPLAPNAVWLRRRGMEVQRMSKDKDGQ